jgi:hypothetical protein
MCIKSTSVGRYFISIFICLASRVGRRFSLDLNFMKRDQIPCWSLWRGAREPKGGNSAAIVSGLEPRFGVAMGKDDAISQKLPNIQ